MPPRLAAGLILRTLKSRTEKAELDKLYPDDGPLRRELYAKYVEALNAGRQHQERAIFGGNRVGKTLGIGGYETAVHLTGLYPHWWEGHRYHKPIVAWAAGTKSVKTRDINQNRLIGRIIRKSTYTAAAGGLVPGHRIRKVTRKPAVADAVDTVWIQHVDGYENQLTFKSYEEGRPGFEADEIDWIWLDEEPPLAIYDECRMRILTVRGRILCTFTPLEGMSETVLSFLEDSDLLA